ncbi:MAG TPA: M23 family metallopeptidase [Terriglobales bacterium]|jgi:murein DD-endopeptidase MepM/ murein hydrolase activator NlpD|nr:M23 family metallopeptidase [Terriglobales bacterium]
MNVLPGSGRTPLRLGTWIPLFVLILLSVTGAEASVGSANGKAAGSWSVRWQPKRVVNGSPVLLQVTPPKRLESVSGKWLEHEVFFSFDPSSKTWRGIAGASLETKPGKYELALVGKTAAGDEVSFHQAISVEKAKYRQIAVTVPKQYTEPSPEQLQEIDQDKALKQRVLGQVSPERNWAGSFLPPVSAPISDVFGTARVFNGNVQGVHQGLDFGVPAGTPVAALNAGTVLLAQLLFFEGNCVVLDHGQGLLTIYMHLSKIGVKEGEQVKRGQQIALSGGTGRASGPHLHVAVRWEGVYLDPAVLLNLRMP